MVVCQMETGGRLGIRTTVILVRMDSVLGQSVGNALEVAEALECLGGHGSQALLDIVCTAGMFYNGRPPASWPTAIIFYC